MKYKTEEEQATRGYLTAANNVTDIPEGTMLIVKNGKLVPVQSPSVECVDRTIEKAVENVPSEITIDDSDISVRSSFVHFFKVESDAKAKFKTQEEVSTKSDLSGQPQIRIRS